jgi:trimeric autotransporter adhesin
LQQQCKLTLGVALTLQEAAALVTDLATPGTISVRGVHFLRAFFKAGDEHKSALAAAAVQSTAAARTRHSRTAAELAASAAAAAVLSTPHTHADAVAARTLLAAAAHAAATASGDSSLNSLAVAQAFAGLLSPYHVRAQIARCWGAATASALTVAQLAAVFAAVDPTIRGTVQGEAFLKWVAGASAQAKAAAAQRAQRNAAARVRVLTAAGVQCAPLQPALLGR